MQKLRQLGQKTQDMGCEYHYEMKTEDVLSRRWLEIIILYTEYCTKIMKSMHLSSISKISFVFSPTRILRSQKSANCAEYENMHRILQKMMFSASQKHNSPENSKFCFILCSVSIHVLLYQD